MGKIITKFDPVTNRTFEEAEEHYLRVHTEFARKMFREHGPTVTTYVINRAMREYSVAGAFNQKPRAWRWVVNQLGGDEFLPEHMVPLIWRDHRNTLKNIRSCTVAERVVADRLSGQTALQKFLVEYDRAPGQSPEEADRLYEADYLPLLTRLLDGAFGFRRFVSNRVLEEADVAPLEEEGQIITGGSRPTEKHGYDEIWFDNETWGSEFFAHPEVYELIQFGGLVANAYVIAEVTGIDRR